MSNPVAYCPKSNRGYAQWEFDCLPKSKDGSTLCMCHLSEVVLKPPTIPPKIFYYTEAEVWNLIMRSAKLDKDHWPNIKEWFDRYKKK